MLYYKCLGKKIVLTAHNINAGRRDGNDTAVNRFTLRVQYRLADHVFVHTEQMKQELMRDLGVREERITVIPFGINNAVPNTELLPSEARRRLGIGEREKTILFFGRITPYKGLEYLAEAFRQISRRGDYRLIIAGRPKECAQYWEAVQNSLAAEIRDGRVLVFPEFIPDEDTEIYFKAADLFVLPYRHIYQSGVLFLGQSFGLPVIVSDVGSLKDDVIEGETGYVIRPEHADELGKTIERYFAGDLYRNVNRRRQAIRDYTAKKHSWEDVSQITMRTYAGLLQMPYPNLPQAVSPSSANAKTSS
jgi:glycosyltransferase involved in cell wall biosynthesis